MSKLFVVPTPIGNLKDITLRALEVLQSVSFIAAEDTRVTAKLLNHYGIKTPLISHHLHNEHKNTESIVSRIIVGESVALVSDAGTPAISDPGFLLVRQCVKNAIEVEVLPGACAAIVGIVGSGLTCNSFVFEGFMPEKKGRQTFLSNIKNEQRTIIFYCSPHKLVKTLEDFSNVFPKQRNICVCRELTKMFEEYKRGSAEELAEYYTQKPPKGEIVIVVEAFEQKKEKKIKKYE